MKVLTLNTWQEKGPWKARWEIIFQGLHELVPDLVGFQEVFNPAWVELIRKRAGYPYFLYPQPDSGLLTLSRYPIQQSAVFQYPTQSPTETYRRYVTLAWISSPGLRFIFANTHLSWLPEESRVREGQTKDFLEIVSGEDKDGTCIAVGDFNAAPQTSEIRAMIHPGGFKDVYGSMHPTSQAVTWDNQNPFAAGAHHTLPDRRIDFLFTRGKSLSENVSECRLVYSQPTGQIFASDHYGVFAQFAEAR